MGRLDDDGDAPGAALDQTRAVQDDPVPLRDLIRETVMPEGRPGCSVLRRARAATATTAGGSCPPASPPGSPVTIVSDRRDLVIRPRLYEADPHRMRVRLRDMLDPVGVRQVHATVTGITPPDGPGQGRADLARPDGATASLPFARLVLAAGSRVIRPDVPGAAGLFDVDSMAGATRLEAHLRRLVRQPTSRTRDTVVVIGAGFTGIEVATAIPSRLHDLAPGRPTRVVLVEADPVVGQALGGGPRPVIEQALDELGVQVLTGRRLGPGRPGRGGAVRRLGDRDAHGDLDGWPGRQPADRPRQRHPRRPRPAGRRPVPQGPGGPVGVRGRRHRRRRRPERAPGPAELPARDSAG